MDVAHNGFLDETIKMEEVFLKISWLSKRHLAHELSHYQLTPPQFAALRCISKNNGSITMSELSDECQAVMPTMTGIIDRLVARDLVSRKRDPNDRRSLFIELTEVGHQMLDEITSHRREQIDTFLSTLSVSERKSLFSILQRYLDTMTEWIETNVEETYA